MAPPSVESTTDPATLSSQAASTTVPATQPNSTTASLPNSSSATLSQPTRQAGVFDALRTIKASDFTTFYQKPCARESLLTGIGAGFAIGGLRFVTLLRPSAGSSGARTGAGVAGETGSRVADVVKRSTPTAGAGGVSGVASAATPSAKGALNGAKPAAPRRTAPLPSSKRPISPSTTLSARAWRSMSWAILSFTLFSAGSHIFCQRRRAMEAAAMARATEIVTRKKEEKRIEAMRRKEERERRRREHEDQKGERSRWGRWFGGSSSSSGGAEGSKPAS